MHGANFIILDMMLVDAPRMLTDEEKNNYKKKKHTVKVDTVEEFEKQLNKMLG